MLRPFPVSRIGSGMRFVVEANQEECRALAARMGVICLHALSCRWDLRRGEGASIEAHGLLRARVRQSCVVSLDPFDAELSELFSVRFVPRGEESEALDVDADDEIGYVDGLLELGEATSEQLALMLDPFPRKPGAELAGIAGAQEEGAFAALAKLLPPH